MEENTQIKKFKSEWLVIVLILIIIAIGILAFWYFSKPKETLLPQPSVPEPSQSSSIETPKSVTEEKIVPEDDSISVIEEDIEKIDVSDLEAEFKTIDEDLNSL